MLPRWQKSASKLLPDHSKAPRSRQTLKVIGVGTAATPMLLRKFRKFASRVVAPCQRWIPHASKWVCHYGVRGGGEGICITVCRSIHDDKASVDLGGVFAVPPVHGVGVPAEAVSGFVEVYIVSRCVQGPESSNA